MMKSSGGMGASGCQEERVRNQMSYTWEIVTAVAEAEGVDVTELEPPLADVLDVDALEALLRSADTNLHVTFEYCGWNVEVRADRTVAVSDPLDGV